MTFHTRILWAQNHWVLVSVTYMDLLKFMMELDI